MLFRISLDVLGIDTEAVQYALKNAYDRDQYAIERSMLTPLSSIRDEAPLYNRGFALAGQMTKYNDTNIFVGLTSGLLHQKCGMHIRIDYMVMLIQPEQVIGIPLNFDGVEQVRHCRCSPSMAPESIRRFMDTMDTAIRTVF